MGIETEESRSRVSLLDVPVDIIAPEQIAPLIYDFLQTERDHNIILLSLWDLLRARKSGEYRDYVFKASLIIPISRSMISGIKFLTGKKAFRYMPFDFIVNILTILEKREYSCYIIGGKNRILQRTEKNIRQTFPKLRLVGRFPGYFKRRDEATIIQAIKKASPSLLLAGKGVRGDEKWIARNSAALGKGVRLWCSDIFDVFAEKKKYPSRPVFERGFEWIGYCFQKPYKFLRIFRYIHYKALLFTYRVFLKNR